MILHDYQRIEELTADARLSPQDQQEVDNLNAVIMCDPKNLRARMKKGFIFFEAHMDGKGIQVFNEILGLDPMYVDAYIWLVEFLLFHWADAESAVIILQQAENIAPYRAELHYLWGCAYREQEDTLHFVQSMKRAIELDPTLISPRMCLVEYFVDHKQNHEAKVELAKLEQSLQPDFPVPTDEMDYYYETLITGRVMAPYAKKCLKKLQQDLHGV